jgi:RNA polymerase sigma-70 factor (ECF subfamily)
MSDLDLILSYKNGDENAFNVLYERYNKIIFRVIHQFIDEIQTIKDYSQEIWFLISKKIDKFKNGNFFLWVYTIAKNYCIDIARKNKRLKKKYYEFSYLYCQFIADENDTEHNLNYLSEGFDKLNDLQRKIIVLRMQGHTFQKISDMLGICLNTILSNNYYIKNKLKKHFSESYA